ncbi:unnamed protein product [Rhodiola kirilowii]
MGIALYKLWAFIAKFLNPSFIKKGVCFRVNFFASET